MTHDKITTEAVNRFLNPACYCVTYTRPWRSGNTSVLITDENGTHTSWMYVRGVPIAKKQEDIIQVSHGGDCTSTIQRRLNGLPNVLVQRIAFVWHLNGRPMLDGWITV